MPILNFESFSQAVSAGGATGSGRANLDGQNYQLKPSLRDNPSFLRRQLARFKKPKKVLDYENMAEFLASRMATKLLDDPNNEKVPEVNFVVSDTDNKVKVASKYLPKFGELLHDKDTQLLKPDSDKKGKKLTQEQVTQVCDALALSILFKDHDINPQNLGSKGERIDFGHAFNETLSLPKKAGGGVRNKSNEVLDYLNREELPSNAGAKSSKLWRSYEELVVNSEMANSLAKIAELAKNKSKKEIDFAKEGFMELMSHFDKKIQELAKEREPYGGKEWNDLTMKIKALEEEKHYQIESLVAINTNLGGPKIAVSLKSPEDAIDKAFETIANDHNKQAQDMEKVAQLMNIQIMFKDKVKNNQVILPQEIELFQQNLKELKFCDTNGKVTWIKEKKNEPAFKGTIQEFVLHNAKLYGLSQAKVSNIEADMVLVNKKQDKSKQESLSQFMKNVYINSSNSVSKIYNKLTNVRKKENKTHSI